MITRMLFQLNLNYLCPFRDGSHYLIIVLSRFNDESVVTKIEFVMIAIVCWPQHIKWMFAIRMFSMETISWQFIPLVRTQGTHTLWWAFAFSVAFRPRGLMIGAQLLGIWCWRRFIVVVFAAATIMAFGAASRLTTASLLSGWITTI